MDIVIESVKLASELHSRQRKKRPIVPGIPYMGHLMEVAGIVQANGGDEITVAAALLHDAIEDQGGEARKQIREKWVNRYWLSSKPVLRVRRFRSRPGGNAKKPTSDRSKWHRYLHS